MELALNETERNALITLLEMQLSDTRVEVRRTGKADWHENLREHEDLLRSLLDRLKQLEK